jgi:hypothetical protein
MIIRDAAAARRKKNKRTKRRTRTYENQEHVIEEGLLKYDNNKDRIYTRNCI